MNRPGSSDDIARIEDRIEALNEAIARCRKISLAAKVAIVSGAAWLVLTVFWLVPFVAYMVIAAMAAVIGGVVLLGSNSTTWVQTEAALAASETLRRDMIDQMQLTVIEDAPRTLH